MEDESEFFVYSKRWQGIQEVINLVKVYASCNLVNKRGIWEKLVSLKRSMGESLWCVVGNFNVVRRREEEVERSEKGSQQGGRKMEEFNSFINKMELIDTPLVGMKFTWVRAGGNAMSRIDRILVSMEWLQFWPNAI